jgi:flagellar biosynthetic protein FliR
MLTGADAMAGLPALELAAAMTWAFQFLFSMLRIGAFLIASPLFGARFIPLPVRIVAAAALTLPALSLYDPPGPDAFRSLALVPAALTEIAIGAIAGLLLTVVFGAATLAGDRIANTAGLGFASQVDPANGLTMPVVSQMFSLFLLAVFVSQDGHLTAIRLLLESYAVLPPGQPADLARGAAHGLEAVGLMFVAGAQLMMPAVTVLLLVNMVVGVVTRSAPQLNIFSVGFPMTILAGVALLWWGAPTMGVALSALAEAALMRLSDGLQGLADG